MLPQKLIEFFVQFKRKERKKRGRNGQKEGSLNGREATDREDRGCWCCLLLQLQPESVVLLGTMMVVIIAQSRPFRS